MFRNGTPLALVTSMIVGPRPYLFSATGKQRRRGVSLNDCAPQWRDAVTCHDAKGRPQITKIFRIFFNRTPKHLLDEKERFCQQRYDRCGLGWAHTPDSSTAGMSMYMLRVFLDPFSSRSDVCSIMLVNRRLYSICATLAFKTMATALLFARCAGRTVWSSSRPYDRCAAS